MDIDNDTVYVALLLACVVWNDGGGSSCTVVRSFSAALASMIFVNCIGCCIDIDSRSANGLN